MATSKSTLKRDRQNGKRRMRNRMATSAMKTQIKKLDSAIEEKSPDTPAVLKETIKKVNKTASKGVIHKNKASRINSRLTKRTAKAS